MLENFSNFSLTSIFILVSISCDCEGYLCKTFINLLLEFDFTLTSNIAFLLEWECNIIRECSEIFILLIIECLNIKWLIYFSLWFLIVCLILQLEYLILQNFESLLIFGFLGIEHIFNNFDSLFQDFPLFQFVLINTILYVIPFIGE